MKVRLASRSDLGNAPSFCILSAILCEFWGYFFLKQLVEFASEAIWTFFFFFLSDRFHFGFSFFNR